MEKSSTVFVGMDVHKNRSISLSPSQVVRCAASGRLAGIGVRS